MANRYRSLQQLFRWLEDDREIPRSPMDKMRPPKVPDKPVPVLTEDQVRAILATCSARTFEALRDTAIIMLLYDTGGRLAETTNLTWVEDDPHSCDVDLDEATILVHGKGGRPRLVPIGRKTVKAIDRYLRERRRHPGAASAIGSPRCSAAEATTRHQIPIRSTVGKPLTTKRPRRGRAIDVVDRGYRRLK